MKLSISALSFFVGALVLGGCGLTKDVGVRVEPASSSGGFGVFQSTLYPVVSSRCSSCHSSAQAPAFAGNANSAYQTIKNSIGFSQAAVNFGAPQSSLLVEKSQDSHCGSICAANSQLATLMASAINEWGILGECTVIACPNNQGGGPGLDLSVRTQLGAVVVPANLTNNFQTLSFPIAASILGFTGATFRVEISRYQNGTAAYLVRNPSIILPANRSVHITDIVFLVNGVYPANTNTFRDIDGAFSSGAAQATVLISPFEGSLPQYNGRGVDTITPSFSVLTISQP